MSMNGFAVFFNQYGSYCILALVLVDAVMVVLYIGLRKRIASIFRGGSMDLEEALRSLQAQHDALHAVVDEHGRHIASLEELVPKDLSTVGLVRFNPFADAGGDQSFALALLNREASGIVISSLYGREINRIYAKSIEKGESKYQLSDEERQAIEQAMRA